MRVEGARQVERKSGAKSPPLARAVADHSVSAAVADQPGGLFNLQRTLGNQFVYRLLRSSSIQAKLTISEPGDQHEQEADRVADEVMRMPDTKTSDGATSPQQFQEPQIQRLCSKCEREIHRQPLEDEKEETRHAGPVGLKVQRKCSKCEEETRIQRDAENHSHSSNDAQSLVDGVLRSSGHPLRSETREFFEPRFGRDFSSVRVHTDDAAAASAQAISARAYTYGQHIVFGPGQFSPATDAGRRLLAHELVHVAQQAPGAVARKPAPSPGSQNRLPKGPGEPNSAPEVHTRTQLPHLNVNRLSVQPMIQRDFALEPPHPAAAGRALTAPQMQDAINFNNTVIGAAGADVIGEVRDVLGISSSPAVVDEDFVNAVVRWQARQGLTQDGKLGPTTASPLFREIGAEGVGECKVKSGAAYTPGAPAAVAGGLFETTHFALDAEFESDPANHFFPSCCEVRQFIRWNAAAAAGMGPGGAPHGGFPAGTPVDTFTEDRDAANHRFGHRSGPFSDPQTFDQYTDSTGARNQAFGHIYHGTDDPSVPPAMAVGQWRFYIKVIDVCRGGVRAGGDSVIRVDW